MEKTFHRRHLLVRSARGGREAEIFFLQKFKKIDVLYWLAMRGRRDEGILKKKILYFFYLEPFLLVPFILGSQIAGSQKAGSQIAGSQIAGSRIAGSQIAGSRITAQPCIPTYYDT